MSNLANFLSLSKDQQKQILTDAGYDINQPFDYDLVPLATFIKLDDLEETFEYLSDYLEIDPTREQNLNSLDDLSHNELIEFLDSFAASDEEAGNLDYWSMSLSLNKENLIVILQVKNGPNVEVDFSGVFKTKNDAISQLFVNGFIRENANWVKV